MDREAAAYSCEGRPRVTKDDIVAALRTLGIRAGDDLFAHTSLSAFGYVDGGAEAVGDALLTAVAPGGTVAVPTFTWGRNHDQETVLFDVCNDPCETGAVPDSFRQRPEAIRSEHVCHSVAAIGPQADAVMGDGIRPFAWGSSFYRLYKLDFWYVFLGCDFQSCTALHTVEESMSVPYRYYRHFEGSVVILPDHSTVPSKALEFLRYSPYQNDFARMESVYAGRGALRGTTVGNARIIGAKTGDIVNIGVELLKKDIAHLLREESRHYFARNRMDLERPCIGAPSPSS